MALTPVEIRHRLGRGFRGYKRHLVDTLLVEVAELRGRLAPARRSRRQGRAARARPRPAQGARRSAADDARLRRERGSAAPRAGAQGGRDDRRRSPRRGPRSRPAARRRRRNGLKRSCGGSSRCSACAGQPRRGVRRRARARGRADGRDPPLDQLIRRLGRRARTRSSSWALWLRPRPDCGSASHPARRLPASSGGTATSGSGAWPRRAGAGRERRRSRPPRGHAGRAARERHTRLRRILAEQDRRADRHHA